MPTSGFAYCIDTKIVSFRNALFSSASLTLPLLSTGIKLTLKPSFSSLFTGFKTEKCSIEETIICLPLVFKVATRPFIAKLFDSVPQDVKITSSLSALIKSAACRLAVSRASLEKEPKE